MVKEEGVVAGHLEVEMRPRRKLKMQVLAGTRGTRVSTALVIKTLEIKEEEVEDVDKVQEKKDFVVPIFIAVKKVIMLKDVIKTNKG